MRSPGVSDSVRAVTVGHCRCVKCLWHLFHLYSLVRESIWHFEVKFKGLHIALVTNLRKTICLLIPSKWTLIHSFFHHDHWTRSMWIKLECLIFRVSYFVEVALNSFSLDSPSEVMITYQNVWISNCFWYSSTQSEARVQMNIFFGLVEDHMSISLDAIND